MPEHRSVTVPEGLEGERVDAAMARLFGLSRTKAADLIAGRCGAGRRRAAAQERAGAIAGVMLEVELPDARRPVAVDTEPVPGLVVLHDDDDIVVVDKPVGVAAHPSPGWTGPTVVGGSGRRPATASRPAAPPSARVSCTGSTSEPVA